MRLLELADAPRDGSREGALLVPEQFRFEEVVGDRRAVDRDEGLVLAKGFGVHVTGEHFLAGAALAGDQDRRLRPRDLLGQLDDALHGLVAPHERAAVGGDRLEHRGNEVGVRRQRDVFLGAGLDGGDRGARVGAGSAGDHRRADALGVERRDEVAHRQADVDHDEIGAFGAQHREALLDAVRLGHPGAAAHGDLGGGDEFAVEPADDEKTHGFVPSDSRLDHDAFRLNRSKRMHVIDSKALSMLFGSML